MARSRAKKNVPKASLSSGNARIVGKGRKRNKKNQRDTCLNMNLFDDTQEQRIEAIRAVRDIEIEHLLIELHLLVSCISEEQKRLPVLEFFQKNMPNLPLEKNASVLTWREAGLHTSLLHRLSAGFPGRSSGLSSFRDSFSSDFFPTVGGRTSVGMTPKTVRLPKPGEMLLSVRGSPLGVFKEEFMGMINESEEDRSVE